MKYSGWPSLVLLCYSPKILPCFLMKMKLASRTDPKTSSEIPYSYINDPCIMKIVKDSYGTLNQRFNPIQVQVTTNFSTPSSRPCHLMLSGNKFVPVPMEISVTESPRREKCYNPTFNQMEPPTLRNTPRSTNQRTKSYNPAMLLPLPVPKRKIKYTDTVQSSDASSWISKNTEPTVNKNEVFDDKRNKCKNYQVKTIFCTGTIERLLRWNRNLDDVFCMYETIAPIVSLQEGRLRNQKIMLLRDKKGPILQVQYYTSTHIDINDFTIGQYLRCVGRMIGFNILSAESIREATESEISTLSRFSYVCDYSITHNISTA